VSATRCSANGNAAAPRLGDAGIFGPGQLSTKVSQLFASGKSPHPMLSNAGTKILDCYVRAQHMWANAAVDEDGAKAAAETLH
jgi:hypothetical protein